MATAAIAKAPADGYTIGIATNSFLINPAIHLKLPYETQADFASISMIATQPVALVANAAFPANTLAELIEVAKRSAEPLNYTSPGPRGVGHLAGEMLKQRAGIAMQHISYNGSAPALNDVIGGRVPLMFDIWHSARRYVDTGQLKLIAGAGLDPLPGAEHAPTIAQTFPGFNVVAFNAMIGPAGIPAPVLRQALGLCGRRGRTRRNSPPAPARSASTPRARRRTSSTSGSPRRWRSGPRSPRRRTSRRSERASSARVIARSRRRRSNLSHGMQALAEIASLRSQ